jgi:nicotinic acid phosphoribosyltransferase
MAARATYIGGFNGTSTVLAGQRFEIPIYGTMAHSFGKHMTTKWRPSRGLPMLTQVTSCC